MRYYFTMLDFNTLATVTHTHTHRHYTTLHHCYMKLGTLAQTESMTQSLLEWWMISPPIGPSNGSKYLQLARLLACDNTCSWHEVTRSNTEFLPVQHQGSSRPFSPCDCKGNWIDQCHFKRLATECKHSALFVPMEPAFLLL